MRACDIKQGEVYRLKSSPLYRYVKVLCIVNPKKTVFYKDFNGHYRIDKNKNNFIIVRGIHSVDKNFNFGIMRDFKPVDIINDGSLSKT
jgi:hypothetical protein